MRRATTPSPLARVASEPAVRYEYQGHTFTLDDYLTRHPATGLLVARGNTILIERYQYARHDRHRFASWSMAKTVTAMLVGIALAEGHIRSVDDPAAAYVPALAGTEYGRTSLRHLLLQMSSGVRLSRNTGLDHVWRLATNTFQQGGAGGVDAVTPFNGRAAPSGTKFAYASVEAQVLGLVLRAVVGRPVADYLHEKIWEPMGAEADATWLIDRTGQEATYRCLNAVLRDYARLGLLLAHDGHWRGQQLIPRTWIEDATRVHPDQAHLQPGTARPFFGYGYQVWLFPGSGGCSRSWACAASALRRPGQPARHGPHRRPQATTRSGRREAVPSGGAWCASSATDRRHTERWHLRSQRPPAPAGPQKAAMSKTGVLIRLGYVTHSHGEAHEEGHSV